MNNAAIAQGFAGISQGINQGVVQSYQIEQSGFNQRLQLQKMAQEQQYKQQSMSMEQNKYELQMEQMRLQLDTLKKAETKTKAYNAFNAYLDDGNVRHFNNALKENPELGQLYGNTVRMDPINPNSEEDRRLFQSIGGVGNLDDPSVQKRYVKSISSDGTVAIQDVFSLAKANGTWKTWNDDRLKTLEEEAKIAETNAKASYYLGGGKSSGGGNEPYDIKTAKFEADLSLKIKEGTATQSEIETYNALQSKRGGTAVAVSNLATAPSELVAPPGVDVSKLEGKSKVETQRHINMLEAQPSGKDLNANMRKMYAEGLGSAEGLSKVITDLAKNKNVTTDVATQFLTTAKSKLPEELRGVTEEDLNDVKFKQAFMTVSSVFLKLQSGLTVSDAEREDFMQSMGSLNSNVKVNMAGLRNKFATVVDNYAANRTLSTDLYDYKYSSTERGMRNALESIDEFVKPTKETPVRPTSSKPLKLTVDKVNLGNSIFFGAGK